MSKRITIVLTDEEYAALEQRAQQDRRTVRQMAERLVTQADYIRIIPTPYPTTPWWNPIISSPNTCDGTSNDLTKFTVWNGTSPTSGKLQAIG